MKRGKEYLSGGNRWIISGMENTNRGILYWNYFFTSWFVY